MPTSERGLSQPRTWFDGPLASQHVQFAFDQSGDHSSYVAASFKNHFPVGNAGDSAVLPHLVRRGNLFLILFASLLTAAGNVTRFGYDPNCGCSGRQAFSVVSGPNPPRGLFNRKVGRVENSSLLS